jgi:hypothetical protein
MYSTAEVFESDGCLEVVVFQQEVCEGGTMPRGLHKRTCPVHVDAVAAKVQA